MPWFQSRRRLPRSLGPLYVVPGISDDQAETHTAPITDDLLAWIVTTVIPTIDDLLARIGQTAGRRNRRDQSLYYTGLDIGCMVHITPGQANGRIDFVRVVTQDTATAEVIIAHYMQAGHSVTSHHQADQGIWAFIIRLPLLAA